MIEKRERTMLAASLAFSVDGKWVAADHPKGSVRVWQTATGELRWTRSPSDKNYEGPFSRAAQALSVDGDALAVAEYGGPIRVCDLTDGSLRKELVANAVLGLAFPPGDKRLLARTGCELRPWDLENSSEPVEIPTALSFAFSDEGKMVAAHHNSDRFRRASAC